MTSKIKRREQLMWEFTVSHCGKCFTWPGRMPKDIRYTCHKCRRKMRVKERQVRTRAQANLILANNGDFQEKCHNCGQKFGHHVVYHSDLDAYFLNCGNCGEELYELNEKKVKK